MVRALFLLSRLLIPNPYGDCLIQSVLLSGLQKLLTNDIVFFELKASAARSYLVPEYTTTGWFIEKSDVYAFGVLGFQILLGTRKITSSLCGAAEACRYKELLDSKLHG